MFRCKIIIFQGAILHSFCIFTEQFKNGIGMYCCNSQYVPRLMKAELLIPASKQAQIQSQIDTPTL